MRYSRDSAFRTVAALVVLLMVSACAARQRADTDRGTSANGETPPATADDVPVQEFEFEPTVIRVLDNGETVESSLSNLFAEANDYLSAGDCEKAVELYEIVRSHSGRGEYERAATFNIGLCNERRGFLEEASREYDRLISQNRDSEEALIAFFRLAEVLAQQGEFVAIPFLLRRAEGRADLTLRLRLELHLRKGFAYLEQREFVRASDELGTVLALNQSARASWQPGTTSTFNQPVPEHSWVIAQTNYGLGRILQELAGDIKVVLPVDRMRVDLREKWELVEEAQEYYVEAIRAGDPYWSALAGYMTGQLYEQFYFDVLAAEAPVIDSDAVREAYFARLRGQIETFMRSAIEVYESTLAMSYRIGASPELIERTLRRAEFAVDYLENQTGWEEEEHLILQDEHPNSASALREMEFRDELPADGSVGPG